MCVAVFVLESQLFLRRRSVSTSFFLGLLLAEIARNTAQSFEVGTRILRLAVCSQSGLSIAIMVWNLVT